MATQTACRNFGTSSLKGLAREKLKLIDCDVIVASTSKHSTIVPIGKGIKDTENIIETDLGSYRVETRGRHCRSYGRRVDRIDVADRSMAAKVRPHAARII